MLSEYDDLAEHERYCGYRSTLCFQPDCKARIKICQIQDHFKDKHSESSFKTLTGDSKSWQSFLKEDFLFRDVSIIPAVVHGHYFCIYEEIDPNTKNLALKVKAYYVGKPEYDYYLSISSSRAGFLCIRRQSNRLTWAKVLEAFFLRMNMKLPWLFQKGFCVFFLKTMVKCLISSDSWYIDFFGYICYFQIKRWVTCQT